LHTHRAADCQAGHEPAHEPGSFSGGSRQNRGRVTGMKILTILGARPEFIKAAAAGSEHQIIQRLRRKKTLNAIHWVAARFNCIFFKGVQ